MNVENSVILQRMSVFSDSKLIAKSLRGNTGDYFISEAAEHIEGLWKYAGELAAEINKLHKELKDKPRSSLSFSANNKMVIHDHVTACNSVKNPEYNQESWLPQSEQPIGGSDLQRLALIQNYENHHAQEKWMCSEEDVPHHNKKEAPSHVCTAPQHEYLTLALPTKPSHSVQIYGHVQNTPTQFLPLAELLLTILHDLAIRMVDDEQHAVKNQFDTFSCAAIALVNAMRSPQVRHHSKEEGH